MMKIMIYMEVSMKKDLVKLNHSIMRLLKNTKKISYFNPLFLLFLLRTIRYQKKNALLRKNWELKGVHVPPFMIASITSKCNLHCKGCYASVHHKKCSKELNTENWNNILAEAKELGISFILLAGGEPFIREDILLLASKYKEIIFPVFTNGTLINEENIKPLVRKRNIIPIISIEGNNIETDERRGVGILHKAEQVMSLFKKYNHFYGLSFTVTKHNFDTITNEDFINDYIKKGCKLFFYVVFVPIEKGTEDLEITQHQRETLDVKIQTLRNKYKALFIAFPGDEKEFGGCLSSGRGFVHISPEGHLEPCPFAPYSDTNLKEMTLKEALNSKFLKSIRESDEHLSETEHGCALFNKKEWVESILDNSKN